MCQVLTSQVASSDTHLHHKKFIREKNQIWTPFVQCEHELHTNICNHEHVHAHIEDTRYAISGVFTHVRPSRQQNGKLLHIGFILQIFSMTVTTHLFRDYIRSSSKSKAIHIEGS